MVFLVELDFDLGRLGPRFGSFLRNNGVSVCGRNLGS
jgi:hypothetical protein